MENDAKRAVPSKALLAQTLDVLQYFRESARHDDRRSDAQCYADAQWLLRRDSKANAPADLPATSGMVRRDVGQPCKDCDGTRWYGDNGPGIVGNSEFVRCDCGTGEKCRIGCHPYVVIGGVAWYREADLEICRINHVLPNAPADLPATSGKVSLPPACDKCGRMMRKTPKMWVCTACGCREIISESNADLEPARKGQKIWAS